MTSSSPPPHPLLGVIRGELAALHRRAGEFAFDSSQREVGLVQSVEHGVARVSGLPRVAAEELVRFEDGTPGLVLDLDPAGCGIALLGSGVGVEANTRVVRTGQVVSTPVGEALLGRVLDPLGEPLDGRPAISAATRWPLERPAPPIVARAPVTVPLETGIRVIDSMVPIGRGQRELIAGDRQTGKTSIALDAIIHQRGTGVIGIYCAIGRRQAAVAQVVDVLRHFEALSSCVVVVADGAQAPGLQFLAPYAATTIAEYFMEQGRDVVVVYDDLTQHARAYRELSLLLRRPPGREAFPGDIFYIHSRLLERSTHLSPAHGGGSLTALPIVETEAQNLAAYIPTNLISITDGQIYLSPDLFQKGILPAVDVGRSVSRVGGKAQLRGFRDVAAMLKLAYSQFEELETFSRFGTRLDDASRRALEHGRRVREVLKQPTLATVHAAEQIVVLTGLVQGLFDELPLGQVQSVFSDIEKRARAELPAAVEALESGVQLSEGESTSLLCWLAEAVAAAKSSSEPIAGG